MFCEVIGDAPTRNGRKDFSKPREGPPLGFAHLDAQRCLGRDSRIKLEDGSTKSILDIVENKYSGNVLSVNEEGKIEPKRIIGWYKTNLNDRSWVRLVLQNSTHVFGRVEGLWLTNDHEVLTNVGWKQVDKLTINDKIATNHPSLSTQQEQVLTGTLLGDGYLGARFDVNAHLAFTHTEIQKEWLKLKVGAFSNFDWSPLRYYEKRNTFSVSSNKYPILAQWHTIWYGSGIKSVPRDIVEKNFSPLMLATWYLDDGNMSRPNGSYNVRLYTLSFTEDDVEWLASLLQKNGIECNVRSQLAQSGNKRFYYIYITTKGCNRFFSLIAKYVPDCMQYKLPAKYQGKYEEWNIEQGGLFYDSILSMEVGKNAEQTATYCIDVEDNHNFIAGKMVVHNCTRTSSPEYPVLYQDIGGDRYKLHRTRVIFASDMPSTRVRMNSIGYCALTRMINTAQHLLDISTMEQEELGSRPKRRFIVAKQGITAKQVHDSFQAADTVMDNRGLTRFSQSVVIGLNNAPTASNAIEIEVKDLHAALVGEDKERSVTLGMFLIALALKIPPRWLWPATQSGATKADAMYQHIAGMGGGVGHLLKIFQQMLGGDSLATAYGKPIPSYLEVSFDEQDDEQDRNQADIRKTRSEVYTNNLNTGAINERVLRQQMLAVGDLSQQQYEDLELEDGRLPDGQDVLNLFYSTDPALQAMLSLSVGDVLNVQANDAAFVLERIQDKELELRALLQNPSRPKEFEVARIAMAALQALKKLYTQPTPQEQQDGLTKIQNMQEENKINGEVA